MWDLLFAFLPWMLIVLALLGAAIAVLKILEARRNKKLKAEYEKKAKQGGGINGFIINKR